MASLGASTKSEKDRPLTRLYFPAFSTHQEGMLSVTCSRVCLPRYAYVSDMEEPECGLPCYWEKYMPNLALNRQLLEDLDRYIATHRPHT